MCVYVCVYVIPYDLSTLIFGKSQFRVTRDFIVARISLRLRKINCFLLFLPLAEDDWTVCRTENNVAPTKCCAARLLPGTNVRDRNRKPHSRRRGRCFASYKWNSAVYAPLDFFCQCNDLLLRCFVRTDNANMSFLQRIIHFLTQYKQRMTEHFHDRQEQT